MISYQFYTMHKTEAQQQDPDGAQNKGSGENPLKLALLKCLMDSVRWYLGCLKESSGGPGIGTLLGIPLKRVLSKVGWWG